MGVSSGNTLVRALRDVCIIVFCLTYRVLSEIPPIPHNVTLTAIRPTSVDLEWSFEGHVEVNTFEITVQSSAKVHEEKIRIELSGARTHYTLHDLQPLVEYSVYITASNDDGTSGISDRVVFHTTFDVELARSLSVRPGEVIIVVCILCAWFVAIAVFLRNWTKMRIMQPRDYYQKHQPKNLDTIKVVKHPTESVIYRNFSAERVKNMQAREKRLQRMQTMPNIKVASLPLEDTIKLSARLFAPPVIRELDEAEEDNSVL